MTTTDNLSCVLHGAGDMRLVSFFLHFSSLILICFEILLECFFLECLQEQRPIPTPKDNGEENIFLAEFLIIFNLHN